MKLAAAIEAACRHHGDQEDKAGEPYILHLLRVMMAVAPEYRAAAVLHDILEDTTAIQEDLYDFADGDTIDAILILTRRKDEKYKDYILRVKDSGVQRAIQVKLADLADNLSPERASGCGPELRERYTKALKILRGGEE